ncbi:MAG: hypothetical protein WCK02_06275 [Bacteroidota bacterium]
MEQENLNIESSEVILKPSEPTVTLIQEAEITKGAKQKHCVLIHGFNLSSSPGSKMMEKIKNAINSNIATRGWNVWTVDYDTNKPFIFGAFDVAKALYATGYDFSTTILIGYSMGGVVARQMVANGFPCSALLSMCSPHEGTMAWLQIPAFFTTQGGLSIGPNSQDLYKLNTNPADVKMRSRYYFFGIYFQDVLGTHQDDMVVPINSALGTRLGNVAYRQQILARYEGWLGGAPPFDPHMAGLEPDMFPPLVQTCLNLFQRF